MDKETEKRIAEQKKQNAAEVAEMQTAVENGFVFFPTKPYSEVIEMAKQFNTEFKKK